MCKQSSAVTLNVHSKEGEGEVVDVETVFFKSTLTTTLNDCTISYLLYFILQRIGKVTVQLKHAT